MHRDNAGRGGRSHYHQHTGPRGGRYPQNSPGFNRPGATGSAQKPVDPIDFQTLADFQQALSSAIDAAKQAMTSSTTTVDQRKAAHTGVGRLMVLYQRSWGPMDVALLEKIHDYAQQKFHARGLSKWFQDYFRLHCANHLKRALSDGDLNTLAFLLDACPQRLSAEQLTQIRACAASHHQAASQSTDPRAMPVAEQAQRVLGKLGAPEIQGQSAALPPGSKDPDQELSEHERDLDRLSVHFQRPLRTLPEKTLQQMHDGAQRLREAFRGHLARLQQSGQGAEARKPYTLAYVELAFDTAGMYRAQATEELLRRTPWKPLDQTTQPSPTEATLPPPSDNAPPETTEPLRDGLTPDEPRDGPTSDELRDGPTSDVPRNSPRLQVEPHRVIVDPYIANANLRQPGPLRMPATSPALPTLKNDYFDLTKTQRFYARSLAEATSQQIETAFGTATKDDYQELIQFIAYLWTVPMNTVFRLQDLLAKHQTDTPLGEGLTTLCLLWSESQAALLKQLLQAAIDRPGDHPGLRRAQELIAKTNERVYAVGEQLYKLCPDGAPKDIVGLLQKNPWLPVALVKRAWTHPQYGELIQQLHELTRQWQGREDAKDLQAWGATLQTLLPPAPMAWVDAHDFIRRLVEAVKNQQLAEIDFALATHKDALRKSLDTLALELEDLRALEAVFTTLLKPMASGSLLGPQRQSELPWLRRAGFHQMEDQVASLLSAVQHSIQACAHRH
jgi:hypothetical protein